MSYNLPFRRMLQDAKIQIAGNSRLPDGVQLPRKTSVNGHPVTLWVKGKPANGRRQHRIVAVCWCGWTGSAGRVHQHLRRSKRHA